MAKLRLLAVAATISTLFSIQANASNKRMPIDLVGEWCNPTKFDDGVINYQLPSWADGKCDEILGIDQFGFQLRLNGQGLNCIPQSIKTSHDTAPSGTQYTATIVSTCSNPQFIKNTQFIFEFKRYKGNIYIRPLY
jgi:hypothetical protein